jgi:hypothetical protein
MTAIATVGPLLPIAVLRAADAHAGIVPLNIDRDFPHADHWLESKFPLWAKSIVEDWAAGAFDHLDAVLFSRAEDSAQRLYYYLCELKRRGLLAGPDPQIFDAALIGRSSSHDHVVGEVRLLATRLGVSDDALRAALAAPLDAVSHDRTGAPVCLLGGSAPTDRRLHRAVEEAGYRPDGPTLADDWAEVPPAGLAGGTDPAEAIAQGLRAAGGSPRGSQDAAGRLAAGLATQSPAAAIIWLVEEDESKVWQLPAMLRTLKDAGVPTLAMTRRDARAGDGATAEIQSFLKETRS